MSFHHKLTVEHFQLDPASKMRNHLAEDVLDRNMLALMKVDNLINICLRDIISTKIKQIEGHLLVDVLLSINSNIVSDDNIYICKFSNININFICTFGNIKLKFQK